VKDLSIDIDLAIRNETAWHLSRVFKKELRNGFSLSTVRNANESHDVARQIVLRSSQMEFRSGMNPGKADREANVRFSHDNSILVLNSSLKRLATYTVAKEWEEDFGFNVAVADMDGDGPPELVVFSEESEAAVLRFIRGRR
jgi:hypothetical protein